MAGVGPVLVGNPSAPGQWRKSILRAIAGMERGLRGDPYGKMPESEIEGAILAGVAQLMMREMEQDPGRALQTYLGTVLKLRGIEVTAGGAEAVGSAVLAALSTASGKKGPAEPQQRLDLGSEAEQPPAVLLDRKH
jgi:hypothetical protein